MRSGIATVLLVAALVPSARADDPPGFAVGTLSFQGSAPAVPAPAYDVGTLTFDGGAATPAPPTYNIGTLVFDGGALATAPQYDVGTLVFSGRGAAPAFAVGTLEFHPRARPLPKKTRKPATPSVDQPPPVIDFSKIFGLPPPAPTTAPPTSSAPATSQGPTLKKYLLLKHGQTPPLNSDLH